MEEENEKIYCTFKVIALVLICVIVGFCSIFFIGITKVNALDNRSKNDVNDSWSIWTDDQIDTDWNFYNVDYTTSSRSWLQLRDKSIITEAGKKYNLEFKVGFRYYKNSSSQVAPGFTLEIYNDSRLVDMGSLCTTSITQGSVVLYASYMYDVKCVGFSGTSYYPYISFQIHSDEVQTKNIRVHIYSWNYYENTSGVDTNSIINNQNQNTETITDNANQNAENIINNQNQNTDKEIESQKVCTIYNYTNNIPVQKQNAYMNTNGTYGNSENWDTSIYIEVNKGETYIYKKTTNVYANNIILIFDENKNYISSVNTTSNKNEYEITPTQDGYIVINIYKPNNINSFNGKVCTNGNQAMNDSINDLNDSLTSDDIDTSLFSGFDVDVSDTGIVGIITSPLNAISNIMSNTCSDITAPIPFTNKNFNLPCLTPIYEQHFPTILGIWQTVVTGVIAYWVCLNIFHMVHGFSDPTDDKIEVLEL